MKGRLGAPLTQVAFRFKQVAARLFLSRQEEAVKAEIKGNTVMSKNRKAMLIAFVFLILFFCSFTFWKELEADFSAIYYLEGKGYSSVRILRQPAEGHGCKPEDTYRFVFDAIPPEGIGRVEGKVCGGGEDFWYEEK